MSPIARKRRPCNSAPSTSTAVARAAFNDSATEPDRGSTDLFSIFRGLRTLAVVAMVICAARSAGAAPAVGAEVALASGNIGSPSSMTSVLDNQTNLLSVVLAGTGTGSVTSSAVMPAISCPGSCTGTYDAATTIVLTATSASGSAFIGWTGCPSSLGSQCSVPMTAARTVTARFDAAVLGPTLISLAPDNRLLYTPTVETGVVTLSGAAPDGGAEVALSSGAPNALVVPASVTVLAGQSSATFPIRGANYQSEAFTTITATYQGASKTINVAVMSGATVRSLSFSPSFAAGGSPVTGTVEIEGVAPSTGLVFPLQIVGTAATIPASVTIAAGQKQATFPITTQAVATNESVAICVVTQRPCTSLTEKILSVVPSLSVATFEIMPPAGSLGTRADIGGGEAGVLRIRLNAPAPMGGTLVTLASSDETVATVVGSVLIPAGALEGMAATGGSVTVKTLTVPAAKTVTVSASYGGATKTVQVNVLPQATIASVTLAPTDVVGGRVASATITLDRPAPLDGAATSSRGGTIVTLASSVPGAATVPARPKFSAVNER